MHEREEDDAPEPSAGPPPRPPEEETHSLTEGHIDRFLREVVEEPLLPASIGIGIASVIVLLPHNEETAAYYYRRTLLALGALVPVLAYELGLFIHRWMNPKAARGTYAKMPIYFTIGIYMVLALLSDTIQYQEWRKAVRYRAEREKRDKEEDARIEEMKEFKKFEKSMQEYREMQKKDPDRFRPNYDDDIPKSDKPAAPSK